jgi:hypothetical protein
MTDDHSRATGGAPYDPPGSRLPQEDVMQVKLESSSLELQTESPHPARKRSEAVDGPPLSQSEKRVSSENTVYGGLLESNVSFRRDTNGQIYYVVTDAKSGKELRQVPTEEIRKTGEGIAEYLKREQTKTAARLELKA